MERTGWHSQEIFDMVDWAAAARAAGKQIKGVPCTTTCKLEFDLFATMKKWRQNEKLNSGCCPQCGKFNEDFDHILQCPDTAQERIQKWSQGTVCVFPWFTYLLSCVSDPWERTTPMVCRPSSPLGGENPTAGWRYRTGNLSSLREPKRHWLESGSPGTY